MLGRKRYWSPAKLRRVWRTYAICKQYNSKEGTSSDGIADSNRVKSCSEPASEESVSRVFWRGDKVPGKWSAGSERSRIKSLDPRMEGGFLVVSGRLQRHKPSLTRHDTRRQLTHITSLNS